ncbi:MAG: bacteriophage T4 gp5 trimerization domain-containing protein, partial [Geminicoccales bacterium]
HAERNLSTVVENDESRSVGHDRSTSVDNDDTLTVKKNRTADVLEGKDSLTVHKGNREVSVPIATYKLDAKKVEISGLQEIKLAVGPNSIKIDPTGITIFGTLVKIN